MTFNVEKIITEQMKVLTNSMDTCHEIKKPPEHIVCWVKSKPATNIGIASTPFFSFLFLYLVKKCAAAIPGALYAILRTSKLTFYLFNNFILKYSCTYGQLRLSLRSDHKAEVQDYHFL